jgi:hypothetical protein
MQQALKREGFQFDDGAVDNANAAESAPVVELEEEAAGPVLNNTFPITVRLLHKPVRNGKGEEVKELTFREPTGGEVARIGNPVRVDDAGEIHVDDRRMFLMMANLSGVMTPMLERMDPRDYASCAYRLRTFFLPSTLGWWP